MKRALFWLILLVILLGGSSPAPAETPPKFSDRTEVVVVEVPVQVIGDDGQPVRGLTAADFAVWEGRTKHTLIGFESLDLKSAPAGFTTAVPIAARRHFLLLFDLSFSSPKAIVQARGAAKEMVELLHPSDLVSVASYSSSLGAQILLGFTTDRDQILAAVERLGLPSLRPDERPKEPLGLVAVEALLNDPVQEGSRGPARGGGVSSTEMEQVVEREVVRYVGVNKERAVASLARSYSELAQLMAGVRGRKHVVLFSEGFDGTLLTGTANIDEQNEMAEGTQLQDIDSSQRFGSTKTVSQVEEMLEQFRRADCIIQAVDVGGLRAGAVGHAQWAGGKESLFLMARETGGELFENYNQLGAAVAKVLDRTSVTYVLAFQPDVQRDGAYHRIRVDLNGRKGLRVLHRPGYYAPEAYDQKSPLEKALIASQAIISGASGADDTGTIRTSVLAAPFPAEGGTAYVPVLIEVDGPGLQQGVTGFRLPVDVYAYAFDEQGRVRDFFSQAVGLDLLKVGATLQKNGLKFFGHLDLPPGEWSVRVLVRNGATGAMGLKVTSVHVPQFVPGEPVLLPAFFPEPRDRWLVIREAKRQGDREVPYPFMAGEEPFIPASQPILAAGETARVTLVGYHLKPGDVRAEARILTADGREAGTGEISDLQRLPSSGDGSDRLEGAFAAPMSLQPGDYMLMVVLTDSAGGSETSVAPFAVAAGEAGKG
ncbi:MAG TPA: VWA domain-containing protein [Thermoanaerobaculia bacterium]|nr:VWA domain-containing protein [Thermoanaerobaculia bacterium]